MTEYDIYNNLNEQDRLDFELNLALEENGGEITEELQAKIDRIDELNEQLVLEGAADSVARHMCRMKDYTETLKAERDALERRIRRVDESVERRKLLLRRLVDASEDGEFKGVYTIKPYDSKTCKPDNKLINELFKGQAEGFLKQFFAEHPDLKIELKGSASAAQEMESIPEWYTLTETKTIKLIKPRKKNNYGISE